jgi:hypothetical protein
MNVISQKWVFNCYVFWNVIKLSMIYMINWFRFTQMKFVTKQFFYLKTSNIVWIEKIASFLFPRFKKLFFVLLTLPLSPAPCNWVCVYSRKIIIPVTNEISAKVIYSFLHKQNVNILPIVNSRSLFLESAVFFNLKKVFIKLM